jgi:cell division protein FtsB
MARPRRPFTFRRKTMHRTRTLELQPEVQALRTENETLRTNNAVLEARIARLEALVGGQPTP